MAGLHFVRFFHKLIWSPWPVPKSFHQSTLSIIKYLLKYSNLDISLEDRLVRKWRATKKKQCSITHIIVAVPKGPSTFGAVNRTNRISFPGFLAFTLWHILKSTNDDIFMFITGIKGSRILSRGTGVVEIFAYWAAVYIHTLGSFLKITRFCKWLVKYEQWNIYY
jgi:hypothetical protein